MGIGGLAELVEGVHQRLELVGQLGEHRAEHAPASPRQRLAERCIRPAAHRNVVVDVDQLARKATREESGNEQGDVAEPLQAPIAVAGAGRFERLRQHDDERLEARACGRALVESLGAREQRQQIDDIVLRLVLDLELLLLQGAVQGVLEELAQVRDWQYARRGKLAVVHGASLMMR